MLLFSSARRVATRRGFTIAELLVAMALITAIMAVLSQAFTTGIEAFRQLKGIGDMSEELRGAVAGLRRDLLAAHFDADRFIEDTARTGTPDRSAAEDLRLKYEAIGSDALDLEDRLREVERETTNPLARRLMSRILSALDGIEWAAALLVEILDLLAPRSQTG